MAIQALNQTSDIEEIVEHSQVMRASDLAAAIKSEAIDPPDELARLLPSGLPLGSLVAIVGREGSGVATLCYRMLAAATTAGGYVALLDPGSRAMPLAITEAGVDTSRFVLVRPDDSGFSGGVRDRLALALGALLDGFSVVGVLDPHVIGPSLWRRAAGRARERGVLLIAAGNEARESEAASFHLSLDSPAWQLDSGGMLASRTARVSVVGLGLPRSERVSLSPALPGMAAERVFGPASESSPERLGGHGGHGGASSA